MKIVPDADVELLTNLVASGETFEEASVAVIFINHYKLHWNSDVDVVEVAKLMSEHINNNGGTVFSYDWEIFDGVLYIDDKPIKRVGRSTRWTDNDDLSLYWEGRCLSKGELVD